MKQKPLLIMGRKRGKKGRGGWTKYGAYADEAAREQGLVALKKRHHDIEFECANRAQIVNPNSSAPTPNRKAPASNLAIAEETPSHPPGREAFATGNISDAGIAAIAAAVGVMPRRALTGVEQ